MHRRHFDLSRYPFEPSLAAERLHESHTLVETRTRPTHLVELRGIGLLTGDVGCGKTAACRHFIARLSPGLHRVCSPSPTTGSPLNLRRGFADQLNLPLQGWRDAHHRRIRAEILRLARESDQLTIAVLDEAHLLQDETLEELRPLTNFEMDSEPRLCLPLVGLTELRHRLALTMHRALAQRLVVQHHLGNLRHDEIGDCPIHRLRWVEAADPALFQADAIEELFRVSHGLPRVIDRLAHCSPVAAANAKKRKVEAAFVVQATREIDLER